MGNITCICTLEDSYRFRVLGFAYVATDARDILCGHIKLSKPWKLETVSFRTVVVNYGMLDIVLEGPFEGFCAQSRRLFDRDYKAPARGISSYSRVLALGILGRSIDLNKYGNLSVAPNMHTTLNSCPGIPPGHFYSAWFGLGSYAIPECESSSTAKNSGNNSIKVFAFCIEFILHDVYDCDQNHL